MSYKSSLKNWEGLAKRDPLWSICTDPDKKNNQWSLDDFFKTGQEEVGLLMTYLVDQGLMPEDNQLALDFGCGVGRLSRALLQYFDQVIGIDAAPSMIKEANHLNEHKNLSFRHNENTNLELFPDDHFSFIYTIIVLQHIPYPYSIQYIASFINKLKPGGILVFQIPSQDIRKPSLIQKFKSVLKLRERLALIGIGKGFHMNMYCVTEDEIKSTIINQGGLLKKLLFTNHTLADYRGNLTFIDKQKSEDFISNLYIVTKPKNQP